MPRLVIKGSQGKLSRFDLKKGDYRIGRDEVCELQLPNVSVSRVHAHLKIGNNWGAIEDAGSANGILVNGKPTKDTRLYNGDEIDIGRFHLVFIGDGEDDRFYKGRCVDYLPPYAPSAARAAPAGAEATFAMTAEDLARLSGQHKLVDEGKLVSLTDPNRFWHPEERGVSLGGSGAQIRTEGWFMWGTVAEVSWNGTRHQIERKSRWVTVRVNDQPIDKRPLRKGDIIRIGKSSFRYEEPEDPRAARKKRRSNRAQTWTPGS